MLTETVSLSPNVMHAAATWLANSRAGYCEATDFGGNCSTDDKGAWSLPASKTWSVSAHLCLQFCELCQRCNVISVSPIRRDCSWFHRCDLGQLKQSVTGFRTADKRHQHGRHTQPHKNEDKLAVVVAAHKGAGHVLDWLHDNVHSGSRPQPAWHRTYIYLQTDCVQRGASTPICAPPPSMHPCTEARRCELSMLPNAGREARVYLHHLLRVRIEPTLPLISVFVQEDEAGALMSLMGEALSRSALHPRWHAIHFASGNRMLCAGGPSRCARQLKPHNCTVDTALAPFTARILGEVRGVAECPWQRPQHCPSRGVFAVHERAIRSLSYSTLARLYAHSVDQTPETVYAWCQDLERSRSELFAYAFEPLWHVVFGVNSTARCLREPAARDGWEGLWCSHGMKTKSM
jgi:hypothetical protein